MRRMICRGKKGSLPGYGPILSSLLVSRGVSGLEEARAFLCPDEKDLSDPLLMDGMARARDLILSCAASGRKAVIYGDYDCDGVCASLILQEAFASLGSHADIYIPDRREEGYGLNENAVRRLAEGYGLLITVDCGITSLQETALARALGMTVIVTDHHTPREQLPEADLIVHPQFGRHPCRVLCGAGVAYKLACALLGRQVLPSLDLCALATVADMVPLLGENRTLAALGLAAMAEGARPGLSALMESAGLAPGRKVTGTQCAFLLAPRINACGRMDTAALAVDLLSCRDAAAAWQLAARAEELNTRRRAMEQQVLEEADRQVHGMDLTRLKAITAVGDGWESGVVGLAAGRLAERYGYPAVVLRREGDVCVGSGRSACGVDLYQALDDCADLFIRFGGHRQAAGMTLPADRVQELALRLSDAVEKQLQGRTLMPETVYDSEISLRDVTLELTANLARLEPFGTENPAPLFLLRDVQVLSARAVGAQGAHLKMVLSQDGAMTDAVAFRMGHLARDLQGACDLAVSPQANTFNGHTAAECRVEAVGKAEKRFSSRPGEESLALLQELSALCRKDNNSAAAVRESDTVPPPDRAQGTLYLCRTAETAGPLLQAYPGLDALKDDGPDPRAYTAVWLCGGLRYLGPYRRIVLCDGLLCSHEAAEIARLYPGAEILALPRTAALSARLDALRFTVQDLRDLYKRLRGGIPPDAADPRQAAEAAVLRSMGLADDSMRLLPVQKADPLQDPLYRMISGGNCDGNGI